MKLNFDILNNNDHKKDSLQNYIHDNIKNKGKMLILLKPKTYSINYLIFNNSYIILGFILILPAYHVQNHKIIILILHLHK